MSGLGNQVLFCSSNGLFRGAAKGVHYVAVMFAGNPGIRIGQQSKSGADSKANS